MAEEEVNYASVAFKSNKQPGPEVKKEETVYDEVKVQNRATEQPPDTNASAGVLPDKNSDGRCHHYQQLACCLGTLSVLLVVGIIAVSVHYATFIDENVVTELKQLKENQTTLTAVNRNLANLSCKLSSDNEGLKRNQTKLTLQIHNLTQASSVLEKQVRKLTAETQNLTQKNEELQTEKQELDREKKKLTEQIQHMKTSLKELNISRAQWSVDAYCPKENNKRLCKPCQKGWLIFESGCYAINDAKMSEQKTWEEAQEDCRGKGSDLVVVINADEKKYVNDNSWKSPEKERYWIGLRAQDGKWKWVDGSDLTDNSWIQQPASDGLCAISVKDDGFKSVSCAEKSRWICKIKSLSV